MQKGQTFRQVQRSGQSSIADRMCAEFLRGFYIQRESSLIRELDFLYIFGETTAELLQCFARFTRHFSSAQFFFKIQEFC